MWWQTGNVNTPCYLYRYFLTYIPTYLRGQSSIGSTRQCPARGLKQEVEALSNLLHSGCQDSGLATK